MGEGLKRAFKAAQATRRKPTLGERKRMLIDAIQHCNDASTIAALEAVLIERAAKFLNDED